MLCGFSGGFVTDWFLPFIHSCIHLGRIFQVLVVCGENLWANSLVKEMVYWVARAFMTKYHRLGGLNNRTLFSHSSGGCKSKIKALAGLVSPEASLLVL